MEYLDEEVRTKGQTYIEVNQRYEAGKTYKASENLYEIAKMNERFYAGDHWKGVARKNLIPVTLNFLEQLVDVKVSTVMANNISIKRNPDDLDAENPTIIETANVLTKFDEKVWERNKLDSMNEKGLRQAAVYGLMISHWFWDNSIKTGNDFAVKGDIRGELIRSSNLYVSNPNQESIQKQDWVIITYRVSVEKARQIAKKAGMSNEEIQAIVGDKEVSYEGSDKAYNEQEGKTQNNIVTILLMYEKNHETGTIFMSRHFIGATIDEPIDTKMTRFPLGVMAWKERDAFFYANSEIQFIISNQQHVNIIESLRGLLAKIQAVPPTLYNKNMIKSFTNQVGALIPVNANIGEDISKAIAYKQPANMGIDVDKSVANVLTNTLEFKGINDNVTGASRAENKAAIVAQQRAAGVPLESIKRRFFQYIEDVALIWGEFYKNYYTEVRKVILNKEEVEFTGTDYKDIFLKTQIDVGASTTYTDEASVTILQTLLELGHITPAQFLERMPNNLIHKQQQLIEELGGGDIEKQYNQFFNFVQQLGAEDKQAVIVAVQQMLMQEQGGGGGVQNNQTQNPQVQNNIL